MFSVLHDDRHIHLAVVRHPVSDVMYATQSVTTSERVLRHPCLMTTVYGRWVQTGHDVKETLQVLRGGATSLHFRRRKGRRK